MTLHTQYRPTEFKDVIGQDSIIKSLQAALRDGTSQTFLMVGPSGVGKTTASRIAARELGCKDKDILEIDAATFTKIEDMRTVTGSIPYRPLGGGNRSIIVDECHGLSRQSWQSLLKSLEEPPEWLSWFLCTTELNKVPPNILTRCTRLDFKPVDKDLLFDLLVDVAKKEKLKLDDGILDICVKEARGSPRQALVNLGTCMEAKDRSEAAELLKSAQESPPAIELAKLLLEGAGWIRAQALLNQLEDTDAESIRHVVRDYVTKVILNAKQEDRAGKALEILNAFSEPFYHGDGISPIVMAVGKILLG